MNAHAKGRYSTERVRLGVAGGFIRDVVVGAVPSDVDVIVSGSDIGTDDEGLLAELLMANITRFYPHVTEIETDPPTQFIFAPSSNSVEDHVGQRFDFTSCAALVVYMHEHGTWLGRCDDRFYDDVEDKR